MAVFYRRSVAASVGDADDEGSQLARQRCPAPACQGELRPAVRSKSVPAGRGDWTGFASAALIGVGRTANATVRNITERLQASGAAKQHPRYINRGL